MKQNPMLFAFDLSSNFSRNYYKVKNGKEGLTEKHFVNGLPVFAVKNVIFQILNEIDEAAKLVGFPTHLVLIFDHNDPTFRKRIYPDYKGTRPKKDDDFFIQKRLVEIALGHMGITCISKSGFEADDVLGTIATKCSVVKLPMIIFTKDKDLFVLIDEIVRVFDGQNSKLYDANEVLVSKGVPPSKITDMLVLEGDDADNIIGVSGVGSKSSREILEQFELEEVLSNPEVLLDTKIRTRRTIVKDIQNNGDRIKLMRKVATLITDVDIDCNLKNWSTNTLPVGRENRSMAVNLAFSYALSVYAEEIRNKK